MGNVFFTATQQNQIPLESQSQVPILSDCESPVCAAVASDAQTALQDEDQISAGTWSHISVDHSNVQNEIQAPGVLKLSNVPNKIRSNSNVQPKEDLFFCEICNCAFKFQTELDKHMRIHNGIGLPPSKNNRQKSIKYLRKCQAPSSVSKKEKPFSCHICDRRFKAEKYLRQHSVSHVDKRPYSCHICDRRFKAEKYLRQHSVSHDDKRPYPCNVCDEVFKQSFHLQRHLKSRHAKRERHMPCVSRTNIGDELILSGDISNKVPSYHSKMCRETLTLTSSKSSEMMEASEEALFFCQICDCSFRFKRDLRKHCRIHRDRVYYSSCDVCEKTFEGENCSSTHFPREKGTCNEHPENLWHDERSHPHRSLKQLDCVEKYFTTLKKTSKNVGKPRKFLLMRNRIYKNDRIRPRVVNKKKLMEQTFFKANFESHEEEKRPFGCDTCDKRFKTKWVLLQHFSVHETDRPFGCSYCMRMFKLKKYLISHLRVHEARGQFPRSLIVNTVETSNLLNDTSKICQKIKAKKTYTPSNLSISTENQILCCTFCGKIFKTEAVLLKHLSVHKIDESKTKSFPSNLRRNRFKIERVCRSTSGGTNDPSGRTNENLREKISVKKKYSQSSLQARAKKKNFKCDVCGKKFFWKSHLEYHSVVHREGKPFVCTKCDAKYKREDKLIAHTLYRCSNREHLKQYSLRRESTKSINHSNRCLSCLDIFDHYNSLIQHSKVCSAYAELVRKEEQEVEKLKFFEEKNGPLHREYECSLCNKIFVRAKYFAQHLKNKHDIQFFIHKC